MISTIHPVTKRHIERLADEWVKHGKIIVAVDFDDTLSPWTFKDSEMKAFFDQTINMLKRWQHFGIYLVCWTASNPDRYPEIQQFFMDNRLVLNAINETPVEDIPWGKHKKIYANVYLDDRAGLIETINIVERALSIKESIVNPDKYSPQEIA